MAVDGLLPALSAFINALLIGIGLYVYGSVARRIATRPASDAPAVARGFTWGDAVLAVALCVWFVVTVGATPAQRVVTMNMRDLVANALFSIGLLVVIASFLQLRGIDVKTLAGFSRLKFGRALITALLLLLAAYPIILLADGISQRVLGRGSERQGIIELFNASSTIEQRVMIIFLAVAIAPIAEEFLFRFFLYGVLKRYLGRAVGLLGNALLFAAVHAHVPAFAPLFVLGSCFTLAYEWSGSLLVSMSMHALFNSITLTALAFPDQFPQ